VVQRIKAAKIAATASAKSRKRKAEVQLQAGGRINSRAAADAGPSREEPAPPPAARGPVSSWLLSPPTCILG
jgi:hypothetical protein